MILFEVILAQSLDFYCQKKKKKKDLHLFNIFHLLGFAGKIFRNSSSSEKN